MRSGQMVADRYRLEELIGSGGMGVVWRATDTELDRVVAVKHAKPGDGQRGAEQLRREAKNAARVHHPHAVTLFDAVREDAGCWLIMEYLPAENLADILDRDGPLVPRQAARIGVQIADALAALHANGIVHRDVKPGNVLVTPDGIAKLTDFGISRWTEETLTHTGPVVGTPAYLAPEVLGGRDATPAADVYALGVTLARAVDETGGALRPVLVELTARRPADRPTAAEAKARLAAVAEDTTVPLRSRRRSRIRPRVAVAAVAAAVVAGGGAWLVMSRSDTPAPAPIMADPRNADPCALTDATALRRFGKSTVDEDYGGFNRCDVLVEVGPGDDVDVRIQFENADTAVREAGFDVEKEPPSDGACHRTVRWAEPYQIAVTAKSSDETAADLCAMADAATSATVSRLNGGGIPRRTAPVEAGSLFHADACGLLDGDGLARLPGVDAIHPNAGFANWECRWRSTTGPTSLLVLFDRNQLLTAKDGRPVRLAGRDGFVEPGGYGDGSCLVQVVHRTYRVEEGRSAAELLLVVVSGEQPPDELCAMATDLAGSAAAKLPGQ